MGIRHLQAIDYHKVLIKDGPKGALITDGITITDGGFGYDVANLCNPIVTSTLPWAEISERTGLTIDEIQTLFNNYNEIFIRKRNAIERQDIQ